MRNLGFILADLADLTVLGTIIIAAACVGMLSMVAVITVPHACPSSRPPVVFAG